MTRVLLVSKPVAPPWNDGTKVLVRDLARFTQEATVRVMTVRGHAPDWGSSVEWLPAYGTGGAHAPGLLQNARALLALVRPGAPVDIAHFFFTPNPLTSGVLAPIVRLKGLHTVQTACSPPRSFQGIARLLFADRVVALSRDTARKLEGEGVRRVTVIRPGLDGQALAAAGDPGLAERLGLAGRPVVLFPGDYEERVGVAAVLAAVPRVLAALPAARFVLACRPKTAAAQGLEAGARALAAREGLGEVVTFLGEVKDMAALLDAASVVVLPVGSVHRKVDAPFVLLEAMARGLPVVVSDAGPLPEVVEHGGGVAVAAGDGEALAAALVQLLGDDARRKALGEEARRVVREHFDPRTSARLHEELWAELAAEAA